MKKLWMILTLVLAIALGGCTQQPQRNAFIETNVAYMAVDDTGRTLFFESKPQHIVSLTYGTDEILTDIVGCKRIESYSRWAGDGEISFITKEQAFKVGRKVHDNFEAILALHPDLVVASTATNADLVSSLEAVGVKVYVARSPHNYQEMREKILHLAAAVGETSRGEEIVQDMDARLQKLEQKLSQLPASQRRVAVAFNFTSAMGRRGDLLDSMLTMAHVINGAAVAEPSTGEHGQAAISKEMVVKINPDIFLLPTWNYDNKQDVQGYAYQVMNDPAYQNVKAVQNKQLKFVSDKYRYVASHHIVEAIEKIARTVYPEIF